jgi:hypothetical protein
MYTRDVCSFLSLAFTDLAPTIAALLKTQSKVLDCLEWQKRGGRKTVHPNQGVRGTNALNARMITCHTFSY